MPTHADSIFLDVTGSVLDVELHIIMDLQPSLLRAGANLSVVCDVVDLASRA